MTVHVEREDVKDLIDEYTRRILLLTDRRMQMSVRIDELKAKVEELQAKLNAAADDEDKQNEQQP